MKFYFDHCTSAVLARTLDGFLQNQEHSAHHARDFGLHTKPDIEWMEYLAKTGDDWVVVTGDMRISKNKAERIAFRKANLRGIVLAKGYQKTEMCKVAGIIVANWQTMNALSEALVPPYLCEMPIRITDKFKQLSF